MKRRIGIQLLLATMVATLLPALPASAEPVDTLGVLGCLRTRDAVIGYHEAGHPGNVWDLVPPQYTAGDIKGWVDDPELLSLWDDFDAFVAEHPDTNHVWVQLCIKAGRQDTEPTTLDEGYVDDIVANIKARLPNAELWFSPQNAYEPEDLCVLQTIETVNDAAVSAALVDYAVAQGYGEAGPVMVTLTESLTVADNCFANSLGRNWWGNQLDSFFFPPATDPGPDPDPDPDPGPDPDPDPDPEPPPTGDPGSPPAGDGSGTFIDDDGNTHEGMIEAIAIVGITNGCDAEARLYCPGDNVTRAQMASFIARSLDLPDSPRDFFDDDAGNTHEANINKLAAANITLGCDSTGDNYCPDDFVTREQMASFLARAFDLVGSPTGPFTDVTGTHLQNVNAIAEAEITLGCDSSGTLYCPKDLVRRDQMASFIGRALGFDPIPPS